MIKLKFIQFKIVQFETDIEHYKILTLAFMTHISELFLTTDYIRNGIANFHVKYLISKYVLLFNIT